VAQLDLLREQPVAGRSVFRRLSWKPDAHACPEDLLRTAEWVKHRAMRLQMLLIGGASRQSSAAGTHASRD
jgi:hypothetical protein